MLWVGDEEIIFWKRPVPGVREICDVCETTVFNMHWICKVCGYAVCLDCYERRMTKSIADPEVCDGNKSNYFRWARCTTGNNHFHSSMLPTQIMPSTCLLDLSDMVHKICSARSIKTFCPCQKSVTPSKLLAKLNKRYDHRLPSMSHGTKSSEVNHLNNRKRKITKSSSEPQSTDSCQFKSKESKLTSPFKNLDPAKQPTVCFVDLLSKEYSENNTDAAKDSARQRNWLCEGKLLQLTDGQHPNNIDIIRLHWQFGMDLMSALPLPEYTFINGKFNLASRLPHFFVKPDLGPKMYNAYGWVTEKNWKQGTTNLHFDVSDAVNILVYVEIPVDEPPEARDTLLQMICEGEVDDIQYERALVDKPGALWHIFHANDLDKIRKFIRKVCAERGVTVVADHDPLHDQQMYLNKELRHRLKKECNVEGYAILQCQGDGIFIPAGAPHQVFNLQSSQLHKNRRRFCITRERNMCFSLSNELGYLSSTHSNYKDKLQIKNIIYHTVKDIVSSAMHAHCVSSRMRTDHHHPNLNSVFPFPFGVGLFYSMMQSNTSRHSCSSPISCCNSHCCCHREILRTRSTFTRASLRGMNNYRHE